MIGLSFTGRRRRIDVSLHSNLFASLEIFKRSVHLRSFVGAQSASQLIHPWDLWPWWIQIILIPLLGRVGTEATVWQILLQRFVLINLGLWGFAQYNFGPAKLWNLLSSLYVPQASKNQSAFVYLCRVICKGDRYQLFFLPFSQTYAFINVCNVHVFAWSWSDMICVPMTRFILPGLPMFGAEKLRWRPLPLSYWLVEPGCLKINEVRLCSLI